MKDDLKTIMADNVNGHPIRYRALIDNLVLQQNELKIKQYG